MLQIGQELEATPELHLKSPERLQRIRDLINIQVAVLQFASS